jgi:hypothetical protein
MALVDLEAKLDDITNEKLDLTNNDDFMELQATMAAFPMKITAIQSSSMRSENNIFEIDLEIKSLQSRLADIDKARNGVKGLKDLILKGDENMSNSQMVEVILKNLQEFKESIPTSEAFENLSSVVDGLRVESNTISDWKEQTTEERKDENE